MIGRKTIAIVGSGIAGLSAAWLLSRDHDVTLFEADDRIGGHSNTVNANGTAVDTGFIVFNPVSYPNLVALFDHLGVATQNAPMGFAVSLDGGRSEYSGAGLGSLIGHPRNIVDPRHWRMIVDLARFFQRSPDWATSLTDETTGLADFLRQQGFSDSLLERHILPIAAAIWSTPSAQVMDFPAAAFFRFFANHGLLDARRRPTWKTVTGGSRVYIEKLCRGIRGTICVKRRVDAISRRLGRVEVRACGEALLFDDCVIATHADQALSLLSDASDDERALLSAFRYARNHAVLHRDRAHMPRRRYLWSSWNYLAAQTPGPQRSLSVTYWMSELQSLADRNLFVTLNPLQSVPPDAVYASFEYAHPVFDHRAMAAQKQLWSLQGRRYTWFCGSYFGYGFHEDGLQAGLAVAEQLGGITRGWSVPPAASRIHLRPLSATAEVA